MYVIQSAAEWYWKKENEWAFSLEDAHFFKNIKDCEEVLSKYKNTDKDIKNAIISKINFTVDSYFGSSFFLMYKIYGKDKNEIIFDEDVEFNNLIKKCVHPHNNGVINLFDYYEKEIIKRIIALSNKKGIFLTEINFFVINRRDMTISQTLSYSVVKVMKSNKYYLVNNQEIRKDLKIKLKGE